MAATLGQLFNFLVFGASLVILLNNVMDFRYRLELFKHFEDNLDLLNDVLIMACAFGATFFSITSPYDEEDGSRSLFNTDESFTTVLYMIFLLVTSTSVPTDDPQVLFRTSYEILVAATNGTLVTENLNIYELEDEHLITDIGVWYIQAVHTSKLFIFIASVIYAARVMWDNKPDLGAETWGNFREYLLGRIFLLSMVGVATFYWVINVVNVNNITIRSAVSNAEELLEDYDVGGIDAWLVDPTVQIAFSYMVTLCLLIIAAYIGIFYENFQFGLACVLVVFTQSLVQADKLLIDDASFSIKVVLTMLTGLAFIGTGANWLKDKWQAGALVGRIIPSFIYKAGSILSILSLIFLIAAFTYNWLDFDFRPAGISLAVVEAMNDADARIDGIVNDVLEVARVLDPCLRKAIPSDVTYDGTDVVAAGDAASVDEQIRQAREQIKNNVASADSTCVLSAPDFLIDTGLNARCANLNAELESKRSSLVAAQDQGNALQTPYTGNEDNEFFVDEQCRSTQCTVLLSAGIAAMALSAIPFCGVVGFAAGTAARAGNVVYKIGRKIAKFAPKIKRKRNKIRKMANRIRKLAAASKGKIHFTLKLSAVFIPVILGATVTLCILMFRRDIYKKDDKEGAYERVRQIDVEGDFSLKSFKLIEKLNRGLSMVLGIYLPLTLVNTAFYISLVVMPDLFNSLFNELPQTLVAVKMETDVGYTSLKLAYLVASIGNGLIVLSNLLYLFDNSVIAALLALWDRIKNTGTRLSQLYRESADKREVLANKRLLEYDESTDNSAPTASDGRLRVGRGIRGWSRWARIRFLNVLDVMGNWKSLYFQPLFFSIPALYLVYRGVFVDEKYFVFKYKANQETTSSTDEIGEVVAQEARVEAINQEMDNGLCGLVGQLAEELLDAVGGGMAAIAGSIAEFSTILTGAFDGAEEFLASLADLVEFPSIELPIPHIPGIPTIIGNFGIFGIPFICSTLLLVMWVSALFVDKLGAFAGMLNRLNRGVTQGNDALVITDKNNEYQIAASVAVFILYASLTNILLHMVIGELVGTLSQYDMPFITVDVLLGPDYWFTQLASLLNIMSALSLYLNILLPIHE
jgi:hypothetical protein